MASALLAYLFFLGETQLFFARCDFITSLFAKRVRCLSWSGTGGRQRLIGKKPVDEWIVAACAAGFYQSGISHSLNALWPLGFNGFCFQIAENFEVRCAFGLMSLSELCLPAAINLACQIH